MQMLETITCIISRKVAPTPNSGNQQWMDKTEANKPITNLNRKVFCPPSPEAVDCWWNKAPSLPLLRKRRGKKEEMGRGVWWWEIHPARKSDLAAGSSLFSWSVKGDKLDGLKFLFFQYKHLMVLDTIKAWEKFILLQPHVKLGFIKLTLSNWKESKLNQNKKDSIFIV